MDHHTSAQTTLLNLDGLQALADTHQELIVLVMAIQESFADDLAHIEQSFNAQNAAALGDKLHAIKGYVPLMCQPELAAQLAALENQARHQPQATPSLWAPGQVDHLVAQLRLLLQELQAFAARG